MISFTSTLRIFSTSYCVDSVKQHPLFRLLQKWPKELDSGGFICTIFMDLPKAYDCLPHDLLIVKLEAHGLDNSSLNLISKCSKIRGVIPKGSILGSILSNIFINDIFMIIEQSHIYNFADDNTLYSSKERLTEI